ncbi:unnamed protein product, partial [marine sediment metagenome]
MARNNSKKSRDELTRNFSDITAPDQFRGGPRDFSEMVTDEELLLRENPDEDSVIVDLRDPTEVSVDADGVEISQSSGQSIVDFDPTNTTEDITGSQFDDNLAEYLDDNILNNLAEDIIEKVKLDIQSRLPWDNKYQKGVENLGVIEDTQTDEPFEGAARVTYPILIDGVVQFQARALAEMFPPGGPAKSLVLGEVTREKKEQGKRVKNYMNYQMTVEDEGYFEELDQMLFYLPIGGSAFKKTYWDPLLETVVSKFVRPEDLIVPYTATSLAASPRHTHRLMYYNNEMKKLQKRGFYIETDLVEPSEEAGKYTGMTFMDVEDKV